MGLQGLTRALRLGLRGALIAVVGLLLMLMTTQIVLRYGFNASLLWADEVCRYLLIWLTFLAVALAYERGEVASLSFLSAMLPRVPALVFAALASLASAALCGLLVWYGWIFAERAGQEPIPALRFLFQDLFGAAAPQAPRTFWVYLALPAGMTLLGLRLVADAAIYLRAIGTGAGVFDALGRNSGSVVE